MQLFNDRLIARGYPTSILARALADVSPRATLINNLISNNPTGKQIDKAVKPVLTLTIPGLICPNPQWRKLITLPADIKKIKNFQSVFKDNDIVIRIRSDKKYSEVCSKKRTLI